MEKKHRRRPGTLRYVLAITVFVLILAFIAFVILSGGFDLKKLWRTVAGDYASEYYYENSSGGFFDVVGDGFAVLSSAELYAFDKDGEATVDLLISFSQPLLSCEGNYGAAWDLGGYDVILFSDDGLIFRMQTENPIISVTVNDRGYLCVCTQEAGYGGAVTVYNTVGTALYKWYSGSAYLLSAKLKGKTDLLTLSIGSGGSSLVLMKITDVTERARYNYDGIILDAAFTESGIMAVSDSMLISLSKNLEEKKIYDFSDKHLDAYILSDSFAAVVTGNYQLGGEREIATVGADGSVIGNITISDEIASLDVSGDYVAVLSSGVISVYNYKMQPYADYECLTGAEAIVLRDEGTVIVAGAYAATAYGMEEES